MDREAIRWLEVDSEGPKRISSYPTETVSSTDSGSFLLSALMWSSFVLASFLLMLGLIMPTWGNVFLILVFLIVAVMASWSGGSK